MAKTLLKKLIELVKNSTFQSLATLLVSITIFYLQKHEIRFSYFAEYETELAAHTDETVNRMKILWEGKEIRNLRVRRYIFANLGQKYIGTNDLIDEKLLQIQGNPDCNILEARLLKQSRPELKFDLKKINSNKQEEIQVFLRGKEVVEYKDGVYLNIFYMNNGACDFLPKSRIKGQPQGALNKLDSNAFKGVKISFNFFYRHFVTVFCLLSFLLLSSLKKTFEKLDPKPLFMSGPYWIAFRILFLGMIVIFVHECFVIYQDVVSKLPWL